MDLKLHIVLKSPPANVTYALQKGSGSKYEVVQVQVTDGSDLYFDLTVEIKGDRQNNAQPDFRGPFVQGPVMGRFIYLDIGTYAGQHHSVWGRRLKIPLTGITWPMVTEGQALIATIAGTDKKGEPACATVKPFDGWKV